MEQIAKKPLSWNTLLNCKICLGIMDNLTSGHCIQVAVILLVDLENSLFWILMRFKTKFNCTAGSRRCCYILNLMRHHSRRRFWLFIGFFFSNPQKFIQNVINILLMHVKISIVGTEFQNVPFHERFVVLQQIISMKDIICKPIDGLMAFGRSSQFPHQWQCL